MHSSIKEVTLFEYLTQNDIWDRIHALSPAPFIEENTPEILQMMTGLHYGDRIIFAKILKLDLDQVAKAIISVCADKWKNLVELNASDINLGANNTRKLKEVTTNKEKRTNERDDINKVSAFNTDDLINNDGSNTTGKDDLDGERIRTLTDDYINLNTLFSNLSLVEKTNIINIAIRDVAKFLTLDIY